MFREMKFSFNKKDTPKPRIEKPAHSLDVEKIEEANRAFQKVWHDKLKEHNPDVYHSNFSGVNRDGYLLDKEGNPTELLASHVPFVTDQGEIGYDAVAKEFMNKNPKADIPEY